MILYHLSCSFFGPAESLLKSFKLPVDWNIRKYKTIGSADISDNQTHTLCFLAEISNNKTQRKY
jgi:hypothetical protein